MDGNGQSFTPQAGGLPDGVDLSVIPEEYFAVDGFFDTYVDSLRRNQDVVRAGSGPASAPGSGPGSELMEVGGLMGSPAGSVGGAGGVAPLEKTAMTRRKRATEANKAAQQRYRERKKEKIANMERELREVQTQLAEYGAVKKRNAYLEGMNARLQEQMVELEMEVEKWRSATSQDGGAAGGGGDGGSDGGGDVDDDDGGRVGRRGRVGRGGRGAETTGCGVVKKSGDAERSNEGGTDKANGGVDHAAMENGQSVEFASRDVRESSLRSRPSSGTDGASLGWDRTDFMNGSDGGKVVASKADVGLCCSGKGTEPVEAVDPAVLKAEFKGQIGMLRQHLEKLGIGVKYAPGEGDVASTLSAEAMGEFWGVILKACQACHAVLVSTGPDIGSMMKEWRGEHRGMDDTDGVGGEEGRTPWQVALEAINLRSDQKKEILLLRSRHLDSMKKLYEERQRLNLLAISKMVGAPEDVPNDATIEGKIQSISTGTSLGPARRNVSLGDLLDKIKGNLRMEQKAIMALNCLTLTQLLDCVQATRLLISLHPIHCDALALANAVYCEENGIGASKGDQ